MDREVLRNLLFESLKQHSSTQITNTVRGVESLATEHGYIEKPQGFYSDGYMNKRDQLVVQELIWELIIQGILTPGSDSANPELPFIRLTEYGQRCVSEQRVLPHDYGQYLAEINNIYGTSDATFTVYIEESVQAFIKGLYLSAIVNLGVASERLTDVLIDLYRNTIGDEGKVARFEQVMGNARVASKKFDELYKRLESQKADMPQNLSDNLEMVRFLVELIRKQRNDGGHPTGRKFTRDEALVSLLTFPPHLKIVAQLRDWLLSQKHNLTDSHS